MPMQSPPPSIPLLFVLVSKFNELAENSHTQRLFYLQKIFWELNKTPLNNELFIWLNNTDKTSFENQLAEYQIDINASIFSKGFQFAAAVARYNPSLIVKVKKNIINNGLEYQLMQARDTVLETQAFEACKDDYIKTSLMLNELAKNNERIWEALQRQSEIFKLAKPKIDAVKGNEPAAEPQVSYKTKPLGDQGNNQNFTFEMGSNNEKLVFRVEDRADLGLEQKLQSYPVSSYFIEDVSVFMGRFKNQNSPIEYRPVVLSQFARQGNLSTMAKQLKGQRISHIAPTAKYYVSELTDFFDKLIDAKVYHPDIKLTNFLVDGYRVLISDRKALIDEEHPLASKVRSSPIYAPEEYLECLNRRGESMAYKVKAHTTRLNMPQFMSFQLGMVLKEFLLLTQLDDIPDKFRDRTASTASYFKNPTNPIINLSFLIQELTRKDPTKRMTIKQFNSLLLLTTRTPENFYKEVERVLPSSALGIQGDIDEINALLNDKGNYLQQFFRSIIQFFNPAYYGAELLVKTNAIFNKLLTGDEKEDRLTFYAQKLAKKCYNEFSYNYFKQISNLIEAKYLEKDWEQASWIRKAVHRVTFGLYRVDRVATDLSKIDMGLDLKGNEFQSHVALLQYLPPAPFDRLGDVEATHLKNYILAHLDEIMSASSEDVDDHLSDNEGTEEAMRLIKNTKPDAEVMPSGTVLINEDSLPLGSVVIKDVDQVSSSSPLRSPEANGRPCVSPCDSRFFKSYDSRPEVQRVVSVKTALSRLDGNHPLNKPRSSYTHFV